MADSHQEVFARITLTEYATQLRIMTRQIGGVRYNRAKPSSTAPPLHPRV